MLATTMQREEKKKHPNHNSLDKPTHIPDFDFASSYDFSLHDSLVLYNKSERS